MTGSSRTTIVSVSRSLDSPTPTTPTKTTRRTMTTRPLSKNNNNNLLFVIVLLVSCCMSNVVGEIRSFKGRIDAASNFIHFSEGYLIAPGFVDLSELVFTTLKDDVYDENFDDEQAFDDDNEQDGDGDGGGRQLVSRYLDGHKDKGKDMDTDAQDTDVGNTIDIVLFHEPSSCSNTRAGCDWTELGVGASNGEGGLRWCCSNDAIDLGFCEGGPQQYGRLIVNATTFAGQHRFINVPSKGDMKSTVKYGKLEQKTDSGKYVLIVANCNDEGRDVMVNGKYSWKSKHGYLPGDLFGEMYYFVALTVVYFILFGWYAISMKCHEDAVIPIQKWVLTTIGMGFLEAFFKTGDFFVWNEDGTRFWFAMYTGVFVGVVKRGISRCLVLMVSLGWGVVRDTLGDQLNKIVFFGILYVGTATARDVFTIFAVTENQTLSIEEEEDLFDIVTILTFVVAAIDVTFYMWILDALNGTMQYLENMNQTMKLKRYLRLRCILLLSILFAVVWSVFGLVDTYMDEAMMEEQNAWGITIAWEVNYLFVLISVAVLWRPNPNAKDYAFVMELPALGGNDDDDDNEIGIEFTETVPSANDDDDDEGENGEHENGYHDDISAEEKMDRLKVDDAVDA
mmetsp:Transcript_23407/g.32801  ORF Transcript_23407/g.32801 Transcript_23407/m.32801 type:complete len:621 (-) Transcript_23407:115-1977(-)